MAIIVVSNTSNVARSEILAIVEDSYQFHPNESMQAWLAAGNNKESWNRITTLVHVTDKTKSDLAYLLEPYISHATNPPQRIGNKYHFSEPDTTNPIWVEMFHNGEVHRPWQDVEPFVRERI